MQTILDVSGLSIDDAEELGAKCEWLEDRRGFSRYLIGAEESAWACGDCGKFGGDPYNDCCPHCGFGSDKDE